MNNVRGKLYKVWVCPDCGKSVCCFENDYYGPPTVCKCQYPEYVNGMVEVWESRNDKTVEAGESIAGDEEMHDKCGCWDSKDGSALSVVPCGLPGWHVVRLAERNRS